MKAFAKQGSRTFRICKICLNSTILHDVDLCDCVFLLIACWLISGVKRKCAHVS
ncbi:hypothetical protein EC2730350_4814, partial [Escherichia coli 2730350]